MNRWFRRFLVWLVLSAAIAFLVLSRLPSGRDLARKLSEPTPDSAAAASPIARAADAVAEPPGRPDPEPSPLAEAAVVAPSPVVRTATTRARELELLAKIVDEDPRDIRVCDQLGQSKSAERALADTKTGKNPADENYTFEDLFGSDRKDSLLEAYRMPARAIFQEPAVADLIREVNGYGIADRPDREREGILEKAGFYARVARASATLFANRKKYELLGDRATHLSVLARLALADPRLRESARVTDFCRKLQDDPALPSPEALQAEREELLALIRESGLSPKDLGFDPEEWTKFSVRQERGQLTVSLSGKEPPK